MDDRRRVKLIGIQMTVPHYKALQACLIVVLLIGAACAYVWLADSRHWLAKHLWWIALATAVGEVIETAVVLNKKVITLDGPPPLPRATGTAASPPIVYPVDEGQDTLPSPDGQSVGPPAAAPVANAPSPAGHEPKAGQFGAPSPAQQRRGMNRAAKWCLIAGTVVVLLGIAAYLCYEPLLFAFVESRTNTYLDRCPNSPKVVAEARRYVSPAIRAWRSGRLTPEAKKTLGRIWVELKNNVPADLGGKPLSDRELWQRIREVSRILAEHPAQR